MKKEIIAESKALPFSKVIGFGNLLFVSGMVASPPDDNDPCEFTIKEQTISLLTDISDELSRAGLSVKDILKGTVYLMDINYLSELITSLKRFFGDDLPAISVVQASALPSPTAMIEIEIFASRKYDRKVNN